MRQLRIKRTGLLTVLAVLLLAARAYAAVIGLPARRAGQQRPGGRDRSRSGRRRVRHRRRLAPAGGPRVPWATFEQKSASSQQIFVRAFKKGQWVTQGRSLNIAPTSRPRSRRSTSRAPGAPCRGTPGTSRTRRSAAPADLREPLQRRREHLGARGSGPRFEHPLAQHPHRTGRRRTRRSPAAPPCPATRCRG